MNTPTHRLCVWTGPAFAVLFGIGFMVIAGFIPPPSPNATAAQIAALFRENTTRIRIGLIVTAMSSAMLLPWFTAITIQMRRIEGPHPILAYTQLAAGALAILEFIFPMMIWEVATFRAERPDSEIQLLSDLGWMPLVGVVSTGMVQGVVLGVAILQDCREQPLFPRWSGYFNIWMASLLAPGGIIVFFKTGAFAWNGIISWWVVVSAYFAYIVVNTVLLLAILRREGSGGGRAPYLDTPDITPDIASDIASELADLRRQLALVQGKVTSA